MSSNFVENQEKDLSEDNTKKKSLSSVLTSYMKKDKVDQKVLEKMKKEFLDIRSNMNDVKTSYETLLNIQKKISKAYNQLNEKDE